MKKHWKDDDQDRRNKTDATAPDVAPETPAEKPVVEEPVKTMRCIRECEIPGVGAWRVGDVVTDPNVVILLTSHPYFRTEQPEDKQS